MARSFVRARPGSIARVFPHQGNRRFLKASRSVGNAPTFFFPASGILAGGNVGVVFAPLQFTCPGANPVPTFALAPGSGPVPPGLTLSAAGLLSGTPTTAGSYPFTVRATNPYGFGDSGYFLGINP